MLLGDTLTTGSQAGDQNRGDAATALGIQRIREERLEPGASNNWPWAKKFGTRSNLEPQGFVLEPSASEDRCLPGSTASWGAVHPTLRLTWCRTGPVHDENVPCVDLWTTVKP